MSTLQQEQIRERGHKARYSGKPRETADTLYKRELNRLYWQDGWDTADAEKIAGDLSDPRNAFSLINPSNPFYRET